LSVDCSQPTWVTRVQLGPSNEAANRVYYGHGYCIEKPVKFSAHAGGHDLSTSHVGMEYPAGVAVLLATTTPPTQFLVDSSKNLATLDVRPGTTLSLLPGTKGMFDCATRYRAVNHLKAAPGFATKAGRFCFDIWGGSYKNHNEIVDTAIKYGLTDSLFVNHVWQRFGYDNRLPDIWPPNKRFGELSEMKEALDKCNKAGILYGLHDNYIDFYPDAEGFSPDVLSFEKDGQPRKAWINTGIDARSYQFRPDTFLPFLNRNLDMMLPELPQTCYFVDVFASMPPVDFYDKNGVFHSRAETLDHWNKCFDVIRERLTEVSKDKIQLAKDDVKPFYAPAISESGDDFLAGHLDGSDCQFMFIGPGRADFRKNLECADWARVPWFDAVNHTTFSLHGVGYSGRYEAGRGRLTHGIETDDYISAEMLTGHAAMVDYGSSGRGAVRKYWLMQPTMREIAFHEIDSVEYVDGNIHRLKIVWKSPDGKNTTTIYVNRDQTDWQLPPLKSLNSLKNSDIADKDARMTLPPFGFLATGPAGEAAIFRAQSGDIAEFSASADRSRLFVNGRNKGVSSLSSLVPASVNLQPNSLQKTGDNQFKIELCWDATPGAPLDYTIFVHLVPGDWKPENKKDGIIVTAGAEKKSPVPLWNGKIITQSTPIHIPKEDKNDSYRILVGMYNAGKDGHRATLLGQDFESLRYSVAILHVKRDNAGNVTEMTIVPDTGAAEDPFEMSLKRRLAPPSRPINFGSLVTKGGFVIEKKDGKYVSNPLPDEPEIEWNFVR
ncbi:MAG: hypothetical protein ACRCUY_03040, partial [Thermoguttaceae bacterium]